VADLKLSYTIQFFIQMLCAKYQNAGQHGSEKNVTEFFLYKAHIKIILSFVKQEVDKSYTVQFSILMLRTKYQRAGPHGF
jgi:hypothetical protein